MSTSINDNIAFESNMQDNPRLNEHLLMTATVPDFVVEPVVAPATGDSSCVASVGGDRPYVWRATDNRSWVWRA